MCYFYIGTRPTLPQILSFPFQSGRANIAQKIAKSYRTFGILLLNDKDGATVDSLSMHNQSPEDITVTILAHWLQGQGKESISWETLIAVIRETGFKTLAADITAGLANLPKAF